MKTTLKILLILIIPALLLGFNFFEQSLLYRRLLSLFQVDVSLKTKFLTQYDEPGQLILKRDRDPDEFRAIWQLIKANTNAKLPPGEPYWISRLALENATFVTLPKRGKVVLIPESVPLFAFFCPNPTKACGDQEAVLVGTVGDLRTWTQNKERSVRLGVDVIASLISIAAGVCLEFSGREKDNNKKV